jgi:hypothetical protein
MKFLEGIEENLRFMVLEVTRQVESTLACLENPDPSLIAKIESRDDYIDNLKSVIENVCYSKIHGPNGAYKPAVDMARAVNIVSSNLERVADHAVNIVMQVQYLSDPDFIKRYDYLAGFHEVDKAWGSSSRPSCPRTFPWRSRSAGGVQPGRHLQGQLRPHPDRPAQGESRRTASPATTSSVTWSAWGIPF